MRRVVVTGLGMVTPLGCGVEPSWSRILAGESGAGPITTFDVSDLPAQIACSIPRGDGSNGTFNPDDWMEPKEQRKVDDFIIFAMAAATQALDDANWHPATEEDRCATGTMIGSGIGGISGIGTPPASSVTTSKRCSVCVPKELIIATSVASRPRAMTTRPMRGSLWRASKVYQRPPRKTSNQALKSIGAGFGGTPISPR